MKKHSKLNSSKKFLLVLAVSFMLWGCNRSSMTPTETVQKWNSFMENNQVEEAYGLFATDGEFVDYSGDSSQKGEALKKQLTASANEFKKNRDAGKPLPIFKIVREEISGDTASVPIVYKVGDYPQGRIDFHFIKENGTWKIKRMFGRGFYFR